VEISALASGSSGNSYYVEEKGKAVLFDVGLSCKRIEERMRIIGKTPKNVEGIFITHEHTDHISGVDVFSRKYNVPVFATKKTISNCFLCSNRKLINTIKNTETIKIGKMQIEATPKSHDGADPVFYSITSGKRLSIITDLGKVDKNIVSNISETDFLCLESNHDVDMLINGMYPHFLKKRINSDKGHLSNSQAALSILEHGNKRLKNILLSHLSQNNNTPEKALQTFEILKERRDLNPIINVSRIQNPTPLFRI